MTKHAAKPISILLMRKKIWWWQYLEKGSFMACINYKEQWFLTFFAPWTRKTQKSFHGPPKCQQMPLEDPWILIKVTIMGKILYFCDLRGLPRPSPRTPWRSMDPRLRSYDIEQCLLLLSNKVRYKNGCR